MGSLGLPELIIILIIIILIFGANRLPEIGRGIGKGIRNFKDATATVRTKPNRSVVHRALSSIGWNRPGGRGPTVLLSFIAVSP